MAPNLYDILTEDEIKRIKGSTDLIRNCRIADLTIEEIKLLTSLIDFRGNADEIIFESSFTFDELLHRERLKEKPIAYADTNAAPTK